MKILVTGGAGYIGSRLVPELLNEGHTVTVIDNLMYNQTSLLDCCHHDELTIVREDVRHRDPMESLVNEADLIIPLAAIVGAPACDKDPTAATSINYDAIKLILELRRPDQKIIYPTTNSGYGIGTDNIYCNEETPLNPISLYGRTKSDAEKAILAAGNSITFRLATVFGVSPRMRFDLLVNDFVYRALFDRSLTLFEAHFKRNYVYIGDVVRAFIHAINNFDQMKGHTYNFGLDDANLSKWELCEEIKRHIPQFWFSEFQDEEWAKDPDKRNYIVCNKKIAATGFRATTTLRHGIDELIKGYQVMRRNQYANV